jgi:hypothetical protein
MYTQNDNTLSQTSITLKISRYGEERPQMKIQGHIIAKERAALLQPKKHSLWCCLVNKFKRKEHQNQTKSGESRC